jgi:hypothetical protein
MKRELFKKLSIVLLLAYCIGLIVNISTHTKTYQWDFKVFYFAAKAHSAGLNPYSKAVQTQIAGKRIRHRFVYPPFTLYFFRIFSAFDLNTAYYLFLFLKCVLLIGLIYLWKKIFLRDDAGLLFYLFCLLAFNSTIYVDMLTGNISVLEQFGIWLAFYFFLKRRLLLFCLSLILIASFKLTPLFFLVLLLSLKEKKKWMYFVSSVFLFLGIHLISFLSSPFYKAFLVFSSKRSKGRNFSTFALIREAFQLLEAKTGIFIPHGFQIGVFFVAVVVIIFISWRAYIWLSSAGARDKEMIVIFLACLTYGLILPRFKDYSYILLIVPAYFIIKRISYPKGYILFFILIILSIPTEVHLPGFSMIFQFMWQYYLLVLAFVIWGLYINKIYGITRKKISKI